MAKYAKRPFLASHSNARSIAPNAARNLTDDMIRILAEKGGVMGLNFCVSFVENIGSQMKKVHFYLNLSDR